MTKKQKIWLWVFIIMFSIPELLWSPVINVVYGLSQKHDYKPFKVNFLTSSSNSGLLIFVLFVQLIFSVLALSLLIKNKKNTQGWLLTILVSLFSLFNLFALYFTLAFSRGINF